MKQKCSFFDATFEARLQMLADYSPGDATATELSEALTRRLNNTMNDTFQKKPVPRCELKLKPKGEYRAGEPTLFVGEIFCWVDSAVNFGNSVAISLFWAILAAWLLDVLDKMFRRDQDYCRGLLTDFRCKVAETTEPRGLTPPSRHKRSTPRKRTAKPASAARAGKQALRDESGRHKR